MAEPPPAASGRDASRSATAEQPGAALTKFDRDTAVWREPDAGGATDDGASGRQIVFGAEVAPDWRAGRGPHGGYLAAMLLRALIETVADETRAPRSLTIHYARAPEPGPVQISTVIEREGRSLSTLSARMEQDGRADRARAGGVLGAVERAGDSRPADARRRAAGPVARGGQADRARGSRSSPATWSCSRASTGSPFAGAEQPMEIGAWLGLAEPRPIDALSLAFFSDALIPAPFMRMAEPAAAPTIDLTVHFRARMHRQPDAASSLVGDARELCLAQTTTELIHDGFFEEDGVIWAADGTLLAQSRQLAILIPFRPGVNNARARRTLRWPSWLPDQGAFPNG